MQKDVYVDVLLEVVVCQKFSVPSDYKINENNPYDAYNELIERFGDIDESLLDNSENVELSQLDEGMKSVICFGDFMEFYDNHKSMRVLKFKSPRPSSKKKKIL